LLSPTIFPGVTPSQSVSDSQIEWMNGRIVNVA
jgi:hypothetical protein